MRDRAGIYAILARLRKLWSELLSGQKGLNNAPQKSELTLPLWAAVGLTVLLALPFGLWLGKFNFALWCSFIVWAEYFSLGAKPSALRLIVPAYSAGVILTSLSLWAIPVFSFLPSLITEGDLSLSAAIVIGIAGMVFLMDKFPVLNEGSLPYFNGISMALAVYFTGSYPEISSVIPNPLLAGGWALAMGAFGCFLGLLNVWLLSPRFRLLARSA